MYFIRFVSYTIDSKINIFGICPALLKIVKKVLGSQLSLIRCNL